MDIYIVLLDTVVSIFFILFFINFILNQKFILKLFYLKDWMSVFLSLVNFYILPYFNTLYKINLDSLGVSNFSWFWFSDANKRFLNSNLHKIFKVENIWRAYENLWSYFFSTTLTNALFFFIISSVFITLYKISSLFIEYYRDFHSLTIENWALVTLTIIFYPFFFVVLFLILSGCLRVIFYVFYEMFAKIGVFTFSLKWYLIFLTGYIMRYDFDKPVVINREAAGTVVGIWYFREINFNILHRRIPIISFIRRTIYDGFFNYIVVFYNIFFCLLAFFLFLNFVFFSNVWLSLYLFIVNNLNVLLIFFNKIFIQQIIFILLFIICLLLVVAYYTLLERKVMGSVQRRSGPKFVGYLGVLQPISDGLKLLTKEIILIRDSNVFIFILAPMISFIISIVLWAVIPFSSGIVISDFSLGLFFIFSISSLNVYGVMLGGWSSRSQYSLVGALRAASQVISYELSFGFLFLAIRLISGSFNLQNIVFSQYTGGWLSYVLLPYLVIFLIVMLAETNRAPYDLAEAEAELVAGFHTEYSAILFALFFLAEYANMFLMSVLGSLLFFGGWITPFTKSNNFWGYNLTLEFSLDFIDITKPTFTLFFCLALKSLCFAIFFILVRSALPRYRFDQLLTIGWKRLLPISFSLFVLYLFISYSIY